MHVYLDRARELLTEHRFIANLITTYGIVVVLVLASLVIRRLLGHTGERLAQWTGQRWLDGVSRQAAQQSRRLIGRLTWLGVALLAAAGIGYHLLGRDIRLDFDALYGRITTEHWIALGLHAGALAGLAIAAWVGIRIVRRLRAWVEPMAIAPPGRVGQAGGDPELVRPAPAVRGRGRLPGRPLGGRPRHRPRPPRRSHHRLRAVPDRHHRGGPLADPGRTGPVADCGPCRRSAPLAGEIQELLGARPAAVALWGTLLRGRRLC